MIKRVTLKNFQSHEDSTFEFCPTTNSIIGESNSGKTAVLRAISWVITNRPSGDEFVSHWARNDKGKQIEDTSVTIETDEHIVTRTKSKKGNTYIVDGKVLEAIGLDVPTEVTDALNMLPVNVQGQMDSPFLLAETPGDVARFFNQTVHLDKIDVYLSAVEGKKRKTRSELEACQTNLDATDKELEAYTWVKKATVLVDKLKALEEECNKVQKALETLRGEVIQYVKASQSLPEIVSVIDKASDLLIGIKHYQAKLESIDSDASSLHDTCTEVRRLEAILAIPLDIDYAQKLIDRIGRLNGDVSNKTLQCSDLHRSIVMYRGTDISLLEQEIKGAEASLPTTCPLCGGPLHG